MEKFAFIRFYFTKILNINAVLLGKSQRSGRRVSVFVECLCD
jgi:hypothetical protein